MTRMSENIDIFPQINNAVLDLQSSKLQTFERPLKTLVRLLQDPSLQEINRSIMAGVDFDEFIEESESTGGSFVGSHRLAWPEDPIKVFGLTLILLEKLANNSSYTISFSHTYFYSGSKIIDGIHALTSQLIIPFVRDYKAFVMTKSATRPTPASQKSDRIFIVHGHDAAARESVARFLENLGFEAVILHEQANRGRTVIEKVEANSDVGFAVVLLTPDDLGRGISEADLEPRARQNVLLELGYFIGRLGRENVCALKRAM